MKRNAELKMLCGAACVAALMAACANMKSAGKGTAACEPMLLADPTIFVTDSIYYMYGTHNAKGIEVWESDDLQYWRLAPGAADSVAVMGGRQAYGTKGFWAPQVFRYGDDLYMLYTANENIAIAKSKSPVGPFVQEVVEKIEAPTRQIDPFMFIDEDGSKYLYHVRLYKGNSIWVARMNDDMRTIDPATFTQCVTATEPWEDTRTFESHVPIIEGPTVIRRGDYYYLFYSANHYKSKDYAVGYAVATSPMGPWEKPTDKPVIIGSLVGEPGTGHGDVVCTRDGSLKYVFHTHFNDTLVRPRRTFLVDLNFVEQPSGPAVPVIDPATVRPMLRAR